MPHPDLALFALSILRKALDKIAEIKSLLEERRIGEWRPEECPFHRPSRRP